MKFLFQSPCGEFVYWNPHFILSHEVIRTFQSPCGEFVYWNVTALRSINCWVCFNPLAGNLFIETSWCQRSDNRNPRVSIPLRGICLLKLKPSTGGCSSQELVSIPLRGICLLKPSLRRDSKRSSPLFQSPCGEFVYWNKTSWEVSQRHGEVSIPLRGICLLKPWFRLRRELGVDSFNPLAGNLFIETGDQYCLQCYQLKSFNPLAGNLFIETKVLY